MNSLLLAAALLAPAGDTVVIVLDNSGSMNYRMGRRPRIDAAQDALRAVLDRTPEDTTVAVALLNGRDRWAVPLDGSADRGAAKAAVSSVRAKGGTPLGAAMKEAADALLAARAADPRGDHRLLVVTDGEAGDENLVEAYLPQIQARGIAVDVIGVAMDADHSLATKVATYRNAGDAAQLEEAVADLVLAETSADGGDAADEDFAMLEGLPPDVAAAALTALASPSNDPLSRPERVGGGLVIDGGGVVRGVLTGCVTVCVGLFVLAMIARGLFAQRRASR